MTHLRTFADVIIWQRLQRFHSEKTGVFQGNTLYVGGSGPGNYSRIQDAINDAQAGDTIYVYRGLYKENLWVDKTINLIGENKTMTIIDGNGSGSIVCFSAPWIKICGFTLINEGPNQDDAGIVIQSNHNIIQEHGQGISWP